MGDLLFVLFSVVLPILLLLLGVLAGGRTERLHLKKLTQREKVLEHIRVCNLKRVHDPHSAQQATLVTGQVVIATDYFKSFVTSLRNLVGGEMKAAQTLMIRARREALLRLLDEARQMGATEVWNVRFGSSTIAQATGKRGAMQVEMLAWGTAIVRDSPRSDVSGVKGQEPDSRPGLRS